ncbi:unnamed protein product [Penicillium olsonii]|nr:unnamed protein product [Penicillium olsonii]
MASIYQLNQPSSPFWDFVNGNLEDHPFFAPRGHHGHGHHGRPHPHHNRDTLGNEEFAESGEATASDLDSPNHRHRGNHHGKGPRGKHGYNNHGHHGMKEPQPVESQNLNARETGGDVEPSAAADNSDGSSSESDSAHSRYQKDYKKQHGRGQHGPGPFRGKGGRGGKGKCGHRPPGPYGFHPHGHGHHGPGGFGFGPGPQGMYGIEKHMHGPHHGPYGFPGHHDHRGHRGGPFGFGPRGPRGPGSRGHRGPPGGPFDFLRQIGAGLGFPMETPADGVDFRPSVDVFDTPTQYVIHASLPGAKKSDLSIDYDAEESVLHLAGVVYRPGINEELHNALAMEERGQEIGVFEREVRFGTRAAPASVIVDGISAKLEDGILNVTLPKIVQDRQTRTKKVWIEDSESKESSPVTEKTPTPCDSESENEEEGREYIKVPVN